MRLTILMPLVIVIKFKLLFFGKIFNDFVLKEQLNRTSWHIGQFYLIFIGKLSALNLVLPVSFMIRLWCIERIGHFCIKLKQCFF